MLEAIFWGRGGQGVVTSGQILSVAAFYDGFYTHTFPYFGVERAGAPVQVFFRMRDTCIGVRSYVYNPDVVVVLDASLIKTVDVTKGLKDDGILIINTHKKAEELGIKGKFKIHAIDATEVAMNIFGKPIVNTIVLGAFSSITGKVTLDSLKKAVDEVLKLKGEKVADMNKTAIEKVYNECSEGICKIK